MEVKQGEEVVVTHSDCEDVFVWDFIKQGGSASQSAKVRLPYCHWNA